MLPLYTLHIASCPAILRHQFRIEDCRNASVRSQVRPESLQENSASYREQEHTIIVP